MSIIKEHVDNKFLERLELYGIDKNSSEISVAMFFDGTLESTLLLHLLLTRAKCQVKIYIPNREYLKRVQYKKLALTEIDQIIKVISNTLDLIINRSRDFKIYKALDKVENLVIPEINTVFDDLRFHVTLIDTIQPVLHYFDHFILHQNPAILESSFSFTKILQLNDKFAYRVKLIPIFHQYDIDSFYGNTLAYLGRRLLSLRKYDSNLNNFIKLHEKSKSSQVLNNIEVNELYMYLALQGETDVLIDFIEKFETQIDKIVHLKILEEIIDIEAKNSKIINYIATFANLSSEDIYKVYKKLLYKIRLLDSALEEKDSFVELNTFMNVFHSKIDPNDYIYFFKAGEAFDNNSYEIIDRLILANCKFEDYLLDLVVRNGEKPNKLLERNIFYLINNYSEKLDDIVKKECFLLGLKTNQNSVCTKIYKSLDREILFPLNKYNNKDILRALESEKEIRFSRKKINKDNSVSKKLLEILLQELGNPQKQINNIIYVTGTVAKTSVSLNVKNILTELKASVSVNVYPLVTNMHESITINNKVIKLEELYPFFYATIDAWNKLKYQESYRAIFESVNREMPVELFHILVSILAMSQARSDYNIIESYNLGRLQLGTIFEQEDILITIVNKLLLINKHDKWDYVPDLIVRKLGHLTLNSEVILGKQEYIVDQTIEEYKTRNGFSLIKEHNNWRIIQEEGEYRVLCLGEKYRIGAIDEFEYYDIKNLILAFMGILLSSKIAIDKKEVKGLLFNNKLINLLGNAEGDVNYVMKEIPKNNFRDLRQSFYNNTSIWLGLIKNQIATLNFLNHIEYKHFSDVKYLLLDIDQISSYSINIVTVLLNSKIDNIYLVIREETTRKKIYNIIKNQKALKKEASNKNIKLFTFASSAVAEIKQKVNRYKKDSNILFAIASCHSDYVENNILFLLEDTIFDGREADFLYSKKIIGDFAYDYINLELEQNNLTLKVI